MSNSNDFDLESSNRAAQERVRVKSTEIPSQVRSESEPDVAGVISPSAAKGLRGRGNAPVRAAMLQRLQQTYGNRALQRLLSAQRSAATPTAIEEENLAGQIDSKAGRGNPLDHGTKTRLEGGLGADLSGVRVHTDGDADRLARSVDSVAFTTGSDIFFRQGAYEPGSDRGLHLLAHEATHTVQQSQGPVAGTPTAGGVSVSDPSDQFEQAAERSARNVVAGKSANAGGGGGGSNPAQVQRQGEEDELVQTMRSSTYSTFVQREGEEDELVQTMRSSTYAASVQRAGMPEGEELSVQSIRAGMAAQRHAGDDDGKGR